MTLIDADKGEPVTLMKQAEKLIVPELLLEYGGLIAQIARRFFTSQEDIEDIVADVYLKLVSGAAEKYDGRCRATTYVGQITVNHCIDVLKFRARRVLLLPFIGEHGIHPPEPDVTEALLDLFQNPVREWLRLHYVEGHSYEDLARAEGMKPGCLKTKIRRAIDKVEADSRWFR